ncbi:hypothetical protein FTV88_1829 [Heliorestis convoluta]|uniref:Uncharacterized protein n=1 Tax=Heliorestis convoluta TaxID=356322 RepID=A0A5Q2MZ29_9FIRM|nr:hypothetical protein FTV88_1829 [Heliorestis convoluta]
MIRNLLGKIIFLVQFESTEKVSTLVNTKENSYFVVGSGVMISFRTDSSHAMSGSKLPMAEV